MATALALGVLACGANPASAQAKPTQARESTQAQGHVRAASEHRPASLGVALRKPITAKVAIKPEWQPNSFYCVPMSSSIVLRTFGINVSSYVLANKMHTDYPFGTTGKNAIRALNAYVKPKGYKFTLKDISTAGKAMAGVSNAIGVRKRAAILGVWANKLPWNRPSSKNVGHAIVAYGYDYRKGRIQVWDPSAGSGGHHTISALALARASQKDHGIFYLSR
ncbi:C39 family peptidase [Nonomuraea sp. NPDC046802]|uniref:C39 family peptidase n=1 Tax=Nonomuraea sp. NPDC046802 TaxID=3154919 RepID=UPI0033F21859